MSYSEISSKVVKCRKRHSCGWCSEPIEIGMQAQYRAYVFDGDFGSDHMHTECAAAMHKADNRDLEDGWTPGDYARGSTSGEPIGAPRRTYRFVPMELTDWLAPEVKPLYVGVYETCDDGKFDDKEPKFQHWNCEFWGGFCFTEGEARVAPSRNYRSPNQNPHWRGLASDPSACTPKGNYEPR